MVHKINPDDYNAVSHTLGAEISIQLSSLLNKCPDITSRVASLWKKLKEVQDPTGEKIVELLVFSKMREGLAWSTAKKIRSCISNVLCFRGLASSPHIILRSLNNKQANAVLGCIKKEVDEKKKQKQLQAFCSDIDNMHSLSSEDKENLKRSAKSS